MDIAEFLAGVSPDMPWHVSAFDPRYKMLDVPSTGIESLRLALKIGRKAGLKYVYAGNVQGESENTLCSNCGEVLIQRQGYRILKNYLMEGHCRKCGTALPGVWS